MIPGSLVLEAYDYSSKQQVFWFAGGAETRVLNRFDLGKSFTTVKNATCSVAPISGMQTPDFLSAFRFAGNATVQSPKYAMHLFCL